jgi:hypothetical protein
MCPEAIRQGNQARSGDSPEGDYFIQASFIPESPSDAMNSIAHRRQLEERRKPNRYIRRSKGSKPGRYEAESLCNRRP